MLLGRFQRRALTYLYTDNQDPLLNADTELSVQLSRSDFAATWPTSRTEAEKKATNEFVEYIKNVNPNPNNPNQYSALPATGVDRAVAIKGENRPVRFGDVVGLEYSDSMWDTRTATRAGKLKRATMNCACRRTPMK